MSARFVRAVLSGCAIALLAFPGVVPASGAAPTPVLKGVALGYTTPCVLTSVGGVKCWGWNYLGQVGDGTDIDRRTPVDVVGLTSGITAVAGGDLHACAVTSTGGVNCWGRNDAGQLGDGSTTDRSTPVAVTGIPSGATAVAAGYEFSCVAVGGGAKCWGRDQFGQLGDDLSNTFSHVPVDVVGLSGGVRAVVASNEHACALTSAGGVKCWGRNELGELGNGVTGVNRTASDVVGLTSGVTAISAGVSHTCALTSGGGVKCWGSNVNGELGTGSSDAAVRTSPVDVVGLTSGVVAIAAGYSHTCALTTHGGVKCWGANRAGQLGNGSTTASGTPVDVHGLTSGVTAIAAGGISCALTVANALKCWGSNFSGGLGNGTTISQSPTPVDVAFSAPAPAAPPVTRAWRATVGASGANGTASLAAVSGGVGSIGLAFTRLKPSSTLPVAIYRGSCTSVGPLVFTLASIKSTSAGKASRTNTLTTNQVKLVLAATSGTGKLAIRVGSGSSARCGVFAKVSAKGPQALVQAFYDWYLTDQNYNHLLVRPELTPSFVRFLKGFDYVYNPIVCAQDVPEWATAKPATISGLTATVRVVESFTPSAAGIPVSLTLGPTGWKISAINCLA